MQNRLYYNKVILTATKLSAIVILLGGRKPSFFIVRIAAKSAPRAQHKKEVTLNERLITTLGKGYFRSILISNIMVTSLSIV